MVYKDNWFDRLAINHLSRCVQDATGVRNNKSGYESLVEAARVASQKFDPIQQRHLVIQALNTTLPNLLFEFTRMLPPSKFTRQVFAVFTTFFFAWLIGPSQQTYLLKRQLRNHGNDNNLQGISIVGLGWAYMMVQGSIKVKGYGPKRPTDQTIKENKCFFSF
ncbi:Beta-carotene isomerase d27, chloroplastic [Stylosanthes scabra]|uniref:Beta-carotene isomerase d27, chloroplastic n=1 Tax=Stylosanthes scabra TaxID=79078 RepID=A0ABU6Q4V3_9FABA|nr:Beta-carotene isomerase d27, chloroplastic [Stylosanthes scabra]